VNHDFDFGSSRSQKAWLLLRVFYPDFEHFFVPLVSLDMAQEVAC
jgi:hypothetical protein